MLYCASGKPNQKVPAAGTTTTMKLLASERKKIMKEMGKSPILSGNQKVTRPGFGIGAVMTALDAAGYTLDTVTADMIAADKGNIMLPFAHTLTDEVIDNSRIVFAWELLSPERVEIIAYIS